MVVKNGKKAVIVGAGLGGIGAAIALTAQGYTVEIFEKNAHLGGKLNVLKQGGYAFDLGPSILTMPHLFEAAFESVGKRFGDYVQIRTVSPHWRNFFEDGTCLDLYPTAKDTVAANALLNSRDEEELQRFLAYSKRLYESSREPYFEQGLENVWQMIGARGIWSALTEYEVFRSVDGGVRRHIGNRYLREILAFFVKYVGSSALDAPGVLNLLPYIQAEFGLWYVDGGLYNLALGFKRLLEDIKVTVSLDCEVVEIIRGEGVVTAIRLADGRTCHSDVVVCNMEVVPAHLKLLEENTEQIRRFDRFEPSCSGLVLHLGIDRTYPQLAHHNFLFAADQKKHFEQVYKKKELPDDPTIYLVAPMRTDPSQGPPGCDNLKILPHIPYIQDRPFSAEEYARLKERVLLKLERMGLADLRRHIRVEQMWVPEDIQKLYYSNRGSIYGVVSDRWKNLGFKAPRRSDRFKNLWFVGGSVNPGGGMPMALLSGRLAADRIAAAASE